MMKTNILLALLLSLVTMGSAYSAKNNQFSAGLKTIKELEKEGYSCEKVVAGFWSCKKDSAEYYCRNDECSQISFFTNSPNDSGVLQSYSSQSPRYLK